MKIEPIKDGVVHFSQNRVVHLNHSGAPKSITGIVIEKEEAEGVEVPFTEIPAKWHLINHRIAEKESSKICIYQKMKSIRFMVTCCHETFEEPFEWIESGTALKWCYSTMDFGQFRLKRYIPSIHAVFSNAIGRPGHRRQGCGQREKFLGALKFVFQKDPLYL